MPESQGRFSDQAEKNFEEFRKNIAILSGWRRVVMDLHGNPHYRAKSISFAKMDEDDFEDLFTKTIDVLVKHVCRGYTGDELRRVIEQIQEFE